MGQIKSCSTISEYSVLHDLVYTYMISKSTFILLFLYFLHIVLWKRSLFKRRALRKFILRMLYIYFYNVNMKIIYQEWLLDSDFKKPLKMIKFVSQPFATLFWWAILAKTMGWKITVKCYKHKSLIKNSIPYTSRYVNFGNSLMKNSFW